MHQKKRLLTNKLRAFAGISLDPCSFFLILGDVLGADICALMGVLAITVSGAL